MARLIGDAYIVIYPQTDQFGPMTAAAVKKATAAIRANVPVSPQLDKAAAAAVEMQLKDLGGQTLDLNASLSAASLAAIRGELAGLASDVKMGAVLDPIALAKAEAQLKAISDSIRLGADLDPVAIARVYASLREALGKPVDVEVGLDPNALLRARQQMYDTLGDFRITPHLDAIKLSDMRNEISFVTQNLPFMLNGDQIAQGVARLNAALKDGIRTQMVPVAFSMMDIAIADVNLQRAIKQGIAPALVTTRFDPAQIAALDAGMNSAIKHGIATQLVPVSLDAAAMAALRKSMQDNWNANPVSVPVDTAGAMAKIAALLAYYRQQLANTAYYAIDLSILPALAKLLSLKAAVASVQNTFSTLNALSIATAALTGGLTSLWSTFFISTGNGWNLLRGKIVLFAGVLNQILPKALATVSVWHLAADWVIEFAAVFVPAALAVTAFGAAIAPVLLDAKNRLQAMSEAASALGVTIGVFNYNAKGAVGPMQALQNALQPTVWEVTGDAINVMTSKTGAFHTIVMQVNTVVQDLAARMTDAFSSSSAQTFMQNGALDFQRFGTIIGNLGGALGNFIKDVPGYAEIIQELFVQISKLIENITAFAGPVIKAGLALHGFILYVGLALTAGVSLVASIGNVVGKFFGFVTAATDIGAIGKVIATAFLDAGINIAAFGERIGLLLSNPYVLGLAAIGLAAYAIVTDFNTASASVTNFANNLTTKIANLQGGDALQAIPQALGQINAAIKQAGSPQAYQQLSSNWSNLGNTFNSFAKDSEADQQQWAKAFSDFGQVMTGNLGAIKGWIDAVGNGFKDMFAHAGISIQVTDNIKALETAFNQLSSQEKNLLTVTGQLMLGTLKIPDTNKLATTSTFNYAQSIGILDAAGVQASDSLQLMQTKVAGLLVGWQQYGLNATQIGNAVNAISLQTDMQQTSISKLTGAYSNFIGVVTGGESSFSTFGEGMSTLSQALSQAGAKGVTFNNSLDKLSVKGTAAGATMNGLSQASLNVRGAFASEVTNATNLYNSLLTMSSVSADGAQGQQLLAQAGKDMVATLLPLAKGSNAALAQVSALAQLAGGPATDSFQALSKWVGNTKNPMQDLSKIEQQMTVSSSDLLKDTQNLAGAMGQTLTTAISGAIFAAEKGPQALGTLANALAALAGHTGDVSSVEKALTATIPSLVEMTGSSQLAKNQFIAMAGAFHISSAQATAMWDAIAPNAKAIQQLTEQSQALTHATSGNAAAFAKIPGTLASSTSGYNQLWQAVVKTTNDLISGKGYVDGAKNAFISFAENGLGFTTKAANGLWSSVKGQNLVDLAGKAGTTKSAFIDLANNSLKLTTSQATQLWNTLRLQYLDTLVAKGKTTEGQFVSLAKNGLDLTTSAATQLWNTMRNQYLDALGAKANTTAGQFANVAKQMGISTGAAVTLWGSLQKLPRTVQIAVDETVAGGGKIVVQGNIVANQTTGIATSTVTGEQTFSGYAYAAGGIVPPGGGPAGRDSKLAMVAPGELIIPTSHAPKFSDIARRSGIPGFAAGGVVGQADAVSAMNTHILPSASKTSATIAGMASEALVSAMARTLQAAFAAAQQISMAGVSNASSLAALESAAAKAGWTGIQWTDLYNVEMREAGFNTGAVNPASGAYGMAQFINGPSEYALYGGNATTAAGQAVAMVNYIKSRYGTPGAAWQHEQQFGWYSQGGVVPHSAGGMVSEPVFGYGKFSGMPYSFAERGPEQVIPGGAANAQGQGLPGLNQYQGQQLIQLLQQQNKLLAQMPYTQAQAINQAGASGVRRGYFATSG